MSQIHIVAFLNNQIKRGQKARLLIICRELQNYLLKIISAIVTELFVSMVISFPAFSQIELKKEFQEATKLYQVEKYSKALPLLEKNKQFLMNPWAWNDDYRSQRKFLNMLATCYLKTGNTKAFKDIENFIEQEYGYWELKKECLELMNSGSYLEAVEVYEEARLQAVKEFGKMHASYAAVISNLALLYTTVGAFTKAEPLYNEALQISEKTRGKEDSSYATILGNLALLYQNLGNYSKAEMIHLEAFKIRSKVNGQNHPNYAISLINLADLYESIGVYSKADLYYNEAINIFKELPSNSYYLSLYATTLSNLSRMNCKLGFYDVAESGYKEALHITKDIFGTAHPNYGIFLTNLAGVYKNSGNYTKAEQLYKEALVIIEKSVGKSDPFYPTLINDFANLYYRLNKFEIAGPFYVEALQSVSNIYGKTHPDYTIFLNNLAVLHESAGNFKKAEPIYREVASNVITQIKELFPSLSETEKGDFLNSLSNKFEHVNSFALLRQKQNPAIVALMYNNQLATKALLFNSSNKMRELIMSSNDQHLKQNYQKWLDLKNYLARVYQLNKEEKQKRGIDEKKLEEEANTLEKQLSQQSELFATGNKQYTWQDVQQQLKPAEAAIEIVRFRKFTNNWTDTVYYAALVVTPASRLPQLVLLENGNELEGKYARLYQLAAWQGKKARGVTPAENRTITAAETDSLYQHYWGRLTSVLEKNRYPYSLLLPRWGVQQHQSQHTVSFALKKVCAG